MALGIDFGKILMHRGWLNAAKLAQKSSKNRGCLGMFYGLCWECFRDVLEMFWGYFKDSLGMFWDRIFRDFGEFGKGSQSWHLKC